MSICPSWLPVPSQIFWVLRPFHMGLEVSLRKKVNWCRNPQKSLATAKAEAARKHMASHIWRLAKKAEGLQTWRTFLGVKFAWRESVLERRILGLSWDLNIEDSISTRKGLRSQQCSCRGWMPVDLNVCFNFCRVKLLPFCSQRRLPYFPWRWTESPWWWKLD